jgi:hypothetical protein
MFVFCCELKKGIKKKELKKKEKVKKTCLYNQLLFFFISTYFC